MNGAAGRIGREVVRAVASARGLELAGAIDLARVGEDAGTVAGLAEPLELPIFDDLLASERLCAPPYNAHPSLPRPASSSALALPLSPLSTARHQVVLASLSQARRTGVFVDFTRPETAYDSVKQAVAFGMKAVVGTGARRISSSIDRGPFFSPRSALSPVTEQPQAR